MSAESTVRWNHYRSTCRGTGILYYVCVCVWAADMSISPGMKPLSLSNPSPAVRPLFSALFYPHLILLPFCEPDRGEISQVERSPHCLVFFAAANRAACVCVCVFTTPAVAYCLSPLSKHTALVDITLVMRHRACFCAYRMVNIWNAARACRWNITRWVLEVEIAVMVCVH